MIFSKQNLKKYHQNQKRMFYYYFTQSTCFEFLKIYMSILHWKTMTHSFKYGYDYCEFEFKLKKIF